jgi:hypothetical protein
MIIDRPHVQRATLLCVFLCFDDFIDHSGLFFVSRVPIF